FGPRPLAYRPWGPRRLPSVSQVKPAPNTLPADPVSPDGPGDEDRNLALRAGKGDAAAFGALYDRYVEAVYRYVFYRVRNDADAEDLVSDVFMRALRAIPRYEPRVAFLAWLYRIARNAVIDRARRSRTQISFEDALAHPGVDQVVEPDASILALSDKEALRGRLMSEAAIVLAPRPSWFSFPAILRPALAAAAILVLVLAGATNAAASSLPGDPLYAVKRTSEDVQLALTFDEVARMQLLA